tara:strand:+ start:2046 stop:2507 length:462 start_codon:yes stop_codon:yes gene_type:complete
LQFAVKARSVPLVALWLAGVGVIPFFVCATLILVGPPELFAPASDALLAYGAIILSFLGGIQWGFATRGARAASQSGILLCKLLVSVVPSLVAWVALLAPREPGFMILAGTFLLVFLMDIRAACLNQAPAWYPSLRLFPTLVAVAALIAATFA